MSTLNLHLWKESLVVKVFSVFLEFIPSFTFTVVLLFYFLTHSTNETLVYSNDDVKGQPEMAFGGRNEVKPNLEISKCENFW